MGRAGLRGGVTKRPPRAKRKRVEIPDEQPRWTYHVGLPDRSGLARYTHLIRGPEDLDETMPRHKGRRDPIHWKKISQDTSHWKSKILEFFDAHEGPATWNTIAVTITGTTADIWMDDVPDRALWELVEEFALAWACELGCVWFLPVRFINSEPDPLHRWADDGGFVP